MTGGPHLCSVSIAVWATSDSDMAWMVHGATLVQALFLTWLCNHMALYKEYSKGYVVQAQNNENIMLCQLYGTICMSDIAWWVSRFNGALAQLIRIKVLSTTVLNEKLCIHQHTD